MNFSSILSFPVKSFYSKALYWEAAHRWKIRGFVILLIQVTSVLIPVLFTQMQRMQSENRLLRRVVDHLPEFSISKGHLVFKEPTNFEFIDVVTGSPVLVSPEMSDEEARAKPSGTVVVTRNQIFYRTEDWTHRGFLHAFVFDRTFSTKAEFEQDLLSGDKSGSLSLMTALVITGFFCAFFLLLPSLIIIPLALIWNRIKKRSFSVRSFLRLFIVATTPALIIALTLYSIFKVDLLIWSVTLAQILYFVFGVWSAKSKMEFP